MRRALANPLYRRLFLAQLIALFGTGIATVALALLAYELAGADAGAVLGTALAIKMVAYVTVSPVVAGYADRLPRRGLLVAMDLSRAAIVLLLPFVDAVWQIYLLVFLLQAASAAFTPAFQATIPAILVEEEDYTQALTLARLAYDLESLLSPLVAAALLNIMAFHWLFGATAAGFLLSAALIVGLVLPAVVAGPGGSLWQRSLRGLGAYLRRRELRTLLALIVVAAAGSAPVYVSSVVIVRDALGRGSEALPLLLAAFGGGSMILALLLPRLLRGRTERGIMLAGGCVAPLCLLAAAAALQWLPPAAGWPAMLAIWALLGAAEAALLTPVGRLLRRSAEPSELPALFAAQFALSHLCWLLTYPLAGWLDPWLGLPAMLAILAGLGGLGLLGALPSGRR